MEVIPHCSSRAEKRKGWDNCRKKQQTLAQDHIKFCVNSHSAGWQHVDTQNQRTFSCMFLNHIRIGLLLGNNKIFI